MPIVTPGAFTQAALTAEISTDPLGLGYATHVTAKRYQAVADLMNATPEPIAANLQELIYRRATPTTDLIAAITPAEYTSLTATQRDLAALVFSTTTARTDLDSIRTLIGSIFPAGSASRASLVATASRLCSRSEALWGEGRAISQVQVANALGQV
jgi:hypothetical protein